MQYGCHPTSAFAGTDFARRKGMTVFILPEDPRNKPGSGAGDDDLKKKESEEASDDDEEFPNLFEEKDEDFDDPLDDEFS